jgi:hypothetical protein
MILNLLNLSVILFMTWVHKTYPNVENKKNKEALEVDKSKLSFK